MPVPRQALNAAEGFALATNGHIVSGDGLQ